MLSVQLCGITPLLFIYIDVYAILLLLIEATLLSYITCI